MSPGRNHSAPLIIRSHCIVHHRIARKSRSFSVAHRLSTDSCAKSSVNSKFWNYFRSIVQVLPAIHHVQWLVCRLSSVLASEAALKISATSNAHIYHRKNPSVPSLSKLIGLPASNTRKMTGVVSSSWSKSFASNPQDLRRLPELSARSSSMETRIVRSEHS